MEQEFLFTLESEFTQSFKSQLYSKFQSFTSIKDQIDHHISLIKEWADYLQLNLPRGQHRFITESTKALGKIRMSGLVKYHVKPIPSELCKLNLPEGSKCLVLHLDSLVQQQEKIEKSINLFSLNSRKEMKKAIQTVHQGIAVIVAESWLLDTAIGKRLGFSLMPSQLDTLPSNEGFWGQFIDQYGNVHQQRVEQFIATGIAPFQVRVGYILVEDFLRSI